MAHVDEDDMMKYITLHTQLKINLPPHLCAISKRNIYNTIESTCNLLYELIDKPKSISVTLEHTLWEVPTKEHLSQNANRLNN